MSRHTFLQMLFLFNLSWTLSIVFHHSGLPWDGPTDLPLLPSIGVFDASKGLINQDTVFIDARPFELYKVGFVPSALSWPAGTDPNPEILEAMRRTSKIVFYCDGAGCGAAEKTARIALGLKFHNVYLMVDGYQGWVEKGMPVSRFPEAEV